MHVRFQTLCYRIDSFGVNVLNFILIYSIKHQHTTSFSILSTQSINLNAVCELKGI